VILLSACVIILDQVTKLLVKGIAVPWMGISWSGMALGASTPVLGDFLRITHIENPGMAFGIDVGGKLFFSLFSLAASIALAAYLYHARRAPLPFRVSLAMILGGAVGNLIDRVFYGVVFDHGSLFYGRVVDFIDVDFFTVNLWGYHLSRWPVFNVADASVTIGVLLLLLVHRKPQRPSLETPVAEGTGPMPGM